MADGVRKENWAHTSTVLAMLHNVNCAETTKMKDPEDFNFYELSKGKKKTRRIPFKAQVQRVKRYFVSDDGG